MAKLLLLTCLASTLFMTGVIWFVQVVHYPLFERVSVEAFRRYHADHTRSTTYVVLVPMVLELASSAGLILNRPRGTAAWLAWLGFGLAIVSWGVTFFCSVPAHNRLATGFDRSVHQTLVGTNGLRVLSWTAHSIVVLVMTGRAIGSL
jgi:hypothetical protein